MSESTSTESKRRSEISKRSRCGSDSSKSSSLSLSSVTSQSSTTQCLSAVHSVQEVNDDSTASSRSESTSSGSESESLRGLTPSEFRKYNVEESTPIAIASLVVPSAEPMRHSKEYINISSLFVEPQKVVFTREGGRSNHILINESNVRLAIKVRCSNNRFFRVNPVHMFLDSGTMNELEVLRLPGGEAGTDQLLVCYVVAKEDDDDVKALFTLATKLQWIAVTIITKK